MLQEAFSSYAADYDQHFTHSPIGIMQRQRVYKYLEKIIPEKAAVLELNCGTGEDAHYLTLKGHTVLATDLSPEMVRVAQQKATSNNNKVQFGVLDMNNILSLGQKKFDVLFSNFGGLNCLSPLQMKQFAINCAQQLQNEGQLVFVLMGKKCWWERFYFWWKKDARQNRRSQPEGAATEIYQQTFTTYYYSPSEIKTFFSDHFAVRLVRPIGLFIPPSYLNAAFREKKILLTVLHFFETAFARFAWQGNYADHYLITLAKK